MNHTLNICWLYPDLMGTYGDRGNIIVLQKRCEWRGISVQIHKHIIGSSPSQIQQADILFMGGAQDRQQGLVSVDIKGKKAKIIKEKIMNNTPGLFICGAYQFLGNFYKTADGTNIPGLKVLDMYTVHPGIKIKRAIGTIIVEWNDIRLVGFENHGGRTYLGKNALPFARVLRGCGNNGEDTTEGIQYKHTIGTYLHGPILSKNPELADWFITNALQNKYDTTISLTELEDDLEIKARNEMLRRSG